MFLKAWAELRDMPRSVWILALATLINRMGTMAFQLPAGLAPEALRELERTCVAGGPDNMPWPTEQRLTPDQLALQRLIDESGHLVAPWDVEGFGRLLREF